ncbi:hypothetical protein [Streptomyces sp. NBC_01794]|uniref:hypothetical protein n=1 Tax=Streptomyces sp. NBC_01794 TaxID=2975942 RepID=UPI003091C00E|nr:hypothetical protein OIE54_16195 [Streptomyces sp. NBC_01794]
MNPTPPPPAAQPTTATPPDIRRWSLNSAVLLIPAVFMAGILALSTERGSRCLTYGGDGCSPWPAGTFSWTVIGVVLACVVTIALPARTRRLHELRTAAFALQILLEAFAVIVALSFP